MTTILIAGIDHAIAIRLQCLVFDLRSFLLIAVSILSLSFFSTSSLASIDYPVCVCVCVCVCLSELHSMLRCSVAASSPLSISFLFHTLLLQEGSFSLVFQLYKINKRIMNKDNSVSSSSWSSLSRLSSSPFVLDLVSSSDLFQQHRSM